MSDDLSWAVDGAAVIFKTLDGDFHGKLDGCPFDISRGNEPHIVVRIREMNARYRRIFGRSVVSIAEISSIRPLKKE